MKSGDRLNGDGDEARIKRIRRGGPALDRAEKGLRQLLSSGRYQEGDRLPSERALARELGVARGTMRTTLESAIREGLVGLQNGRWLVCDTVADTSLMNHTIGILTTWPEQPMGGAPSPSEGWERFISIGAVEAVRAAGLHALAFYPERLHGADLKRIVRDLPSGIVVSSRAQALPEGRRVLEVLAKAGANVVVYGNAPAVADFPRVASDHADGARLLTEWLLARGHRRILRVWTPCDEIPYWRCQRDVGYEAAMRAAGMEPLPPVLVPDNPASYTSSDENFQTRVRVMAGHLYEHFQGSSPVDALMLESDGFCYPAIAACRMLGRKVHREVTIVGYDNYWSDCPERRLESVGPAATVDKLNRKIGEVLVQYLLERMSAGSKPAPELRLVKPKLVILPESEGR